ncbi:MAG: DUF565 domain-containing protein [Cyanobacteriota bacterium]
MASGGPAIFLPFATGRLAYQQTRFHTSVIEAGARLNEWATNPWRRLSLQAITLLVSFVIGVGVGAISGAFDFIDLAAALVCVAVMEAGVRGRGWLRRGPRPRLALQLVDMARMGLLYGLLLEGFKLL